MKKVLLGVVALVLFVGLAGAGATLIHLEVPEPSGSYPVGRMALSWTDSSRPELHTKDPNDKREIVATFWFPAEKGTGRRAHYVAQLPNTAGGLVSSGELSRPAVAALRFVRDPALSGARISPKKESYPVVIFSPGNATNAGFYASLVEELASRGYVVVGIDHPYQVAAVELAGGKVAVYDQQDERSAVAGKVNERVADIRFTLDRLVGMRGAGEGIAPQLDLGRIGIMGHSNGGIAAVEACRVDIRLDACLNIDGQSAGGPFSVDAAGGAPDQPFMYLTKERELHPVLAGRFEAGGAGTYRVVVPAAAHDHFGDGALLRPTFNPFARTPDEVITVARGFSRAFFDITLLGGSREVLASLTAPTDVFVNVYPLGSKPSIPVPS